MSTALAILPRIWACQESCLEPRPTLTLVASACPAPPRPPVQAPEPTLAFYRKYTEGMLRRYVRFSMEMGRPPSLLGRELFRAKVTSYRVHSFDDLVIFVHDVEKCLASLTPLQRLLLTRIAMQEYTHQETATMLRVPRRTLVRRYEQSLDRLTGIFLSLDLLEPQMECQGGGNGN